MQSTEGIALRTTNPSDRVSLRGVRLRSRLSGMSQRTTIEQTFVNAENRAIEVVYTFPLPESAAVCGFEIVTGDRVLTGKVEDAEQAIEKYEEAISDGHGAFLMEQDRPDVFSIRVGNLKPRQAATIRLTYVCPLEKADKAIRVAFPTTVAPRYVTDTATDPLEAILDGDAVNPPHVIHVPYGLSIEVDIDLGRDLQTVHSPSHAILLQRLDGGISRVTLAAGMTEMNRDIVLEMKLAREHQPRVQVASGAGGESYLAVTFLPEFDEQELTDPQPNETVFVLDCSGSMQGDSIGQATAALELCLRSLSPGDTFNICLFGSTFELLASEPLPYTQATLDHALKYVRQSADLGGTELHAPLEAILRTKPRAGTVRQIVLLTDGQVSNEPAVIALARRHRSANRIFSFGIGASCSAFLVKGIARATGGASEFITEGERIDEKVLRTFSRLASPMVGDVSIDWDGAEVQTLAELPPVFDGDVMAVYGRAPGRLPKQVTLSCTTPAGPKQWSIPVSSATHDDGVIATTWARRMIQSIEEVNGLHTLRLRNSTPTREQKMLIDLSKEFGLLCSLTTFIAIEHRSVEDRNEGRPELRRVPVALATGWHGTSLASPPSVAQAFACAAPAAAAPGQAPITRYRASSASLGGAASSVSKFRQFKDAFTQKRKVRAGNEEPPDDPMSDALRSYDAGSPLPPADDLTVILSAQMADGSFDWTGQIPQLVEAVGNGAWRPAVESALPSIPDVPSREAAIRTVLVLLLLRVQFADRQNLWNRASRKAVRSFLCDRLGMSVTEIDAWFDALPIPK